MSNYNEEHNISSAQSNSTNNGNERSHQTLSSVLNSFLQQSTLDSESPQLTQTQLETAIRLIDDSAITDNLLEQLSTSSGDVEGLPHEYIDSLDRVDKKYLKPDQTCSICTNDFLDDPHPLVVKLPCEGKHKFDLECISPWLSVKGTCPLCRKNLLKNEKLEIPSDSEEEEEDWEMYG